MMKSNLQEKQNSHLAVYLFIQIFALLIIPPGARAYNDITLQFGGNVTAVSYNTGPMADYFCGSTINTFGFIRVGDPVTYKLTYDRDQYSYSCSQDPYGSRCYYGSPTDVAAITIHSANSSGDVLFNYQTIQPDISINDGFNNFDSINVFQENSSMNYTINGVSHPSISAQISFELVDKTRTALISTGLPQDITEIDVNNDGLLDEWPDFRDIKFVSPDCYSISVELDQIGLSLPDVVVPLNMVIDIRPGVFPNEINLGVDEEVPVAILSDSVFDAPSKVDVTTVMLYDPTTALTGSQPARTDVQDIDGDGTMDLVLYFSNLDLFQNALTENSTKAAVVGATVEGKDFYVQDFVQIVTPGLPAPDCTEVNSLLSQCQADLAQCSADLSAGNASLTQCQGDLADTNDALGLCQADLSASNANLTQCSADLNASNASLTQCSTENTSLKSRVSLLIAEKQALQGQFDAMRYSLDQAAKALSEILNLQGIPFGRRSSSPNYQGELGPSLNRVIQNLLSPYGKNFKKDLDDDDYVHEHDDHHHDD